MRRRALVTGSERKQLKAAMDGHGMQYSGENKGKCECGKDLKGDYDAADQHFLEVAFAAGRDSTNSQLAAKTQASKES